MKKIFFVLVESTILTLFLTMMSEMSFGLKNQNTKVEDQAAFSCRSTLTNLHKCARQTAIAASTRFPAEGGVSRIQASP